jgi:hypothetical protein
VQTAVPRILAQRLQQGILVTLLSKQQRNQRRHATAAEHCRRWVSHQDASFLTTKNDDKLQLPHQLSISFAILSFLSFHLLARLASMLLLFAWNLATINVLFLICLLCVVIVDVCLASACLPYADLFAARCDCRRPFVSFARYVGHL